MDTLIAPLATTRNPFNYEKFVQVERDVSTQWLTTEEISQQLNLVDDESQDPYIASLELAARMAIEDYLGLSIFPVKYRVYYAISPLPSSNVSLDLPQVSEGGITVNSVKYWNSQNVLTTIDAGSYFYDASGNKVILTTTPSDPNLTRTAPVVVEYTTAADPISTYPVVKQAGLLLVTHLYNQRSDTTTDNLKQIPFGMQTLLRSYKSLVM